MIKLVECPRDAMQGVKPFIATEKKIKYLNQLLKVGFDTLDFGSFVSPKAIPQLADTEEVLANLDLSGNTKLLAIVANKRGAESAVKHPEIQYLGYPFSISETFQQRNTNAGIAESLERVKEIQELCLAHNKTLVVYISMAFGNPYGDKFDTDIALEWSTKLVQDLGIKVIALSDTIGVAQPDVIEPMFQQHIAAFAGKDVEIGAHFHSTIPTVNEKMVAALKGGCKRFDGALNGLGGCPMAKDDLTGNIPTEQMIPILEEHGYDLGLQKNELQSALMLISETFPA